MTDAIDADMQALLSGALGRLSARHGFSGRRGAAAPRPVDEAAYRDMAEIGLVALAYRPEAGGFGAGPGALGAVCRVIGRELLIVPFLSTSVLAPALLREVGADRPGLGLEAVLAGERILAAAHAEPGLGYAHGPLATEASGPDGEAAALTGRKNFVLDAGLADAFLVTAAPSRGRTALFLVERNAPGLAVVARHGVDERPVGELVLDHAPATLLAADAGEAVAEALDRGALASCAEALGAMERILEATRDYLQTRRAFGQTLSGFQVLRHRFVDMHVALEEVRAVLGAAEQAWDDGAEDQAALLAACKATTCRNGRFVAEEGIQLHGGIGMTDDLDISHLFKRLLMLEACFGDRDHHLGRHAAALFGPSRADAPLRVAAE